MMSTINPDHWLWRLSAQAWLQASKNELSIAHANCHIRRVALTHCRRSAGMALNAILVYSAEPTAETRWGRSYVEHLQIVAKADDSLRKPLTENSSLAAKKLLEIPVVDSSHLVQIHRSGGQVVQSAIQHAQAIYDDCACLMTPFDPTKSNSD